MQFGLMTLGDHLANPHTGKLESDQASRHRSFVEQGVLAEQVGFVLEARSDINANTNDTADHPQGVWTLPPTLRQKELDKAKYLAIGESDRMTLLFKKIAP